MSNKHKELITILRTHLKVRLEASVSGDLITGENYGISVTRCGKPIERILYSAREDAVHDHHNRTGVAYDYRGV